jgi:hypothetical protein
MMVDKIQSIGNRLSDDCQEAHRGAFWWDEGRRIAVAFGNDGHATDRRAQFEVEAVRDFLRLGSGRELAFATSSSGYSWALACELSANLNLLHVEALLWAAWTNSSPQFDDDFACREINTARAVLERNGLA